MDPSVETLAFRTPLGFALLDPQGRVTWHNARASEMLGADALAIGAPLAKLPGVRDDELRDVLAGRQALPVVRRRGTSARAGGPAVDYDLRRYSEGASAGWVLTLTPHLSGDDEARAGIFYESFLTSTNAMEVTDRHGVLLDVNPAFERIYGYSRAECIGRRPNMVRSRHTRPEVYDRMWADLLDPAKGHWSGEVMNRDRRGHERPVLLTITAVKNAEGETTHYVGVAVDLSERRKWEQSLAHPDRLASIGQLAAGVAHEINTPLANVMLVTESIRRRATDPWMRSRLDTITSQVENAAKIVRGLLDFARRSEPTFVPLDAGEVVRDSIGFLQGKRSPDVEIVERIADEPLPILGDRGQLIQVVTNLINNAYDAIGEAGGRIEIRVEGDGRDAVITVADSGPGIPPEALPHLFEPFFTTKPEGKGTGLGLAICHGILMTHHGTIRATNGPEGGAVFEVRLPVRVARPAGPSAPTERNS